MTSKPSISEMEAWLKEAMPGNAEWSPSDFARLAYQAGVRAGMAQSQDALGYAQRLAKSIASKEYPEVTQFEVLGDLMGVLSQIDNMTCGMTRVLQGGQQ